MPLEKQKNSDLTFECTFETEEASQVMLVVKNPPDNAGDIRDVGSIPESGTSPGGVHGNPLQYYCLDSLPDRGAWQATVLGVAELDITEVT